MIGGFPIEYSSFCPTTLYTNETVDSSILQICFLTETEENLQINLFNFTEEKRRAQTRYKSNDKIQNLSSDFLTPRAYHMLPYQLSSGGKIVLYLADV